MADRYSIPDEYPLDVAALVEPLAVGWNAVALTDAQPDQTALVTGAGPIGLAVLLSLKARDPSVKVFVSAPKSARSQLALDYGAKAVFDPKEVDVVEAVKAATNGNGVHVAYECAGVGSALPVAIQSLRSGGVIVNASVYIKGEPVTVDPNLLTRRGVIYKGSMGYYPGCFAEVVEALVTGRQSYSQPQKSADDHRPHAESRENDHYENFARRGRREGFQGCVGTTARNSQGNRLTKFDSVAISFMHSDAGSVYSSI